ncbi:MAG: hypothetical protein QXS54_02095 [Candidatus Methanomethylicaceae archaeon]
MISSLKDKVLQVLLDAAINAKPLLPEQVGQVGIVGVELGQRSIDEYRTEDGRWNGGTFQLQLYLTVRDPSVDYAVQKVEASYHAIQGSLPWYFTNGQWKIRVYACTPWWDDIDTTTSPARVVLIVNLRGEISNNA